MSNPEPLPCPWCGGDVNVFQYGVFHRERYCSCLDCCARGPVKPDKKKAIQAWNSVAGLR